MEIESEEIDFEILHEILSGSDEDDDDVHHVPPKQNLSELDVQLRKVNKLKSDQHLSNVATVKVVKLIKFKSQLHKIQKLKNQLFLSFVKHVSE